MTSRRQQKLVVVVVAFKKAVNSMSTLNFVLSTRHMHVNATLFRCRLLHISLIARDVRHLHVFECNSVDAVDILVGHQDVLFAKGS